MRSVGACCFGCWRLGEVGWVAGCSSKQKAEERRRRAASGLRPLLERLKPGPAAGAFTEMPPLSFWIEAAAQLTHFLNG